MEDATIVALVMSIIALMATGFVFFTTTPTDTSGIITATQTNKADLGDLRLRINDVETKIDKVKDDLSADIEGIDDANVEDIKDDIENIEDDINDLDDYIDDVESDLNELLTCIQSSHSIDEVNSCLIA